VCVRYAEPAPMTPNRAFKTTCRLDSRAREAGGGLMNCVKEGAINSRPVMAWPAASRSFKVRDIAPQ